MTLCETDKLAFIKHVVDLLDQPQCSAESLVGDVLNKIWEITPNWDSKSYRKAFMECAKDMEFEHTELEELVDKDALDMWAKENGYVLQEV